MCTGCKYFIGRAGASHLLLQQASDLTVYIHISYVVATCHKFMMSTFRKFNCAATMRSTVGPVLNAWFNNCVLCFLPTFQTQ